MEQFEVAHLEEQFVRQIQQFERDLQTATGREVALVAYTPDEDQPPNKQGDQ